MTCCSSGSSASTSPMTFDHLTFSKNRDRLLEHAVARSFSRRCGEEAQRRRSCPATTSRSMARSLDAWASMKSVQPRDGSGPPTGGGKNPTVDFHGQRRTNETHVSSTDPEARLARKAGGADDQARLRRARLDGEPHGAGRGHPDHRSDGAGGTRGGPDDARPAAPVWPATLGADKGYDTADFVAACRGRACRRRMSPSTPPTGAAGSIYEVDPALAAMR